MPKKRTTNKKTTRSYQDEDLDDFPPDGWGYPEGDDNDDDDDDDYPRYSWRGGWENYGPRRQAKNGIKAKSQRGAIGEKWWSKRFVQVLESFTDAGRLSRGRSYARSGQVMDLKIAPGKVSAKVQGSSRTPYKVTIEMKLFSDAEWRKAEEMMARQAIFMAKLLAGEMPQQIEEAFNLSNLALFPKRSRDLATNCSCPDASNPCKHIAATYYILAEQFDENPFLIFSWRGREKEQLIKQLRELRGSKNNADKPAEAKAVELMLPAVEMPPLSDCLTNFWQVGTGINELQIRPQAAAIPDALLRRLGRAPIDIAGENLSDRLEPIYRIITIAGEKKALGELE